MNGELASPGCVSMMLCESGKHIKPLPGDPLQFVVIEGSPIRLYEIIQPMCATTVAFWIESVGVLSEGDQAIREIGKIPEA